MIKTNSLENYSKEDKEKLLNLANSITDMFVNIFNINPEDLANDTSVYNNDDDIIITTKLSSNNEKEEPEKESEKETEQEQQQEYDIDLSDLSKIIDTFFNKASVKENKEETKYNTKCDNCSKTQNNVKQRLYEEAMEETYKQLKEDIIYKISEILETPENKQYKIYKKTKDNPAAAEIILNDIPSYINNTGILTEIQQRIKTKYDFKDVYVHCNNLNENNINLTIYIILD